MHVFCTNIDYSSDISLLRAFLPEKKASAHMSKSTFTGTVLAYALLAYGLGEIYGISPPAYGYTRRQKPYFVDREDIHFSISHTDTHCLCALNDAPIGADIQTKRAVSPALVARVLSAGEDPADFFTYWTLKEAYIKFIGKIDRPLNQIEFTVSGSYATFENTQCYTWRDIPNCSASLCALRIPGEPKLKQVTLEDLMNTVLS